jgi:hypothetical protein
MHTHTHTDTVTARPHGTGMHALVRVPRKTLTRTLGVNTMPPNAENVSYSSFSSTSGCSPPMNKFAPVAATASAHHRLAPHQQLQRSGAAQRHAPTSRLCLFCDDLFARMGLPNSFTMFITLMA